MMAKWSEISITQIMLLAAFLPLASTTPMCGLVPPKQAVRDVQPTGSNTSGGTQSNSTDDVVATAWYPGWLGGTFTPDMIPWSKYTAMTFAFAVTTSDVTALSLDSTSEQVLPTFVSTAKQNNVSALVSIGGWTGSLFFSTNVATSDNRTAFVKTISDFATKWQLDGIDFDWEYPNKQGIGCNQISPDDSANFLLLLQELRQTVGPNFTLTAAVGITPWNGPDGTPMTDVSGFADVLDNIAIMNYDVWGSWSNSVGPNAPLNDSCAPTQDGSATSAVKAWTAAGFPANQIALGVAAYGHSFHVDQSAALDSSGNLVAYPAFDKSLQPLGDSEDSNSTTGVDQCGNPAGGPSGVFNFWGLIEGGFLNADGTPAQGIDYRFDNCSQTPYVYNSTTEVMVSYDDAKSFAAKGQFINDQGLKGFAMWQAAGDSNNILMDAISDGMGLEEVCSSDG
ncbi:glycoside hydrolase [Cyathus striatus]|nr:glycoside hydrolase [Cyathus striatus]